MQTKLPFENALNAEPTRAERRAKLGAPFCSKSIAHSDLPPNTRLLHSHARGAFAKARAFTGLSRINKAAMRSDVGSWQDLPWCIPQATEIPSCCVVVRQSAAIDAATKVGQPAKPIKGIAPAIGIESGVKFNTVSITKRLSVEPNSSAVHLVDAVLIPP
jgi:hypothetical protein